MVGALCLRRTAGRDDVVCLRPATGLLHLVALALVRSDAAARGAAWGEGGGCRPRRKCISRCSFGPLFLVLSVAFRRHGGLSGGHFTYDRVTACAWLAHRAHTHAHEGLAMAMVMEDRAQARPPESFLPPAADILSLEPGLHSFFSTHDADSKADEEQEKGSPRAAHDLHTRGSQHLSGCIHRPLANGEASRPRHRRAPFPGLRGAGLSVRLSYPGGMPS